MENHKLVMPEHLNHYGFLFGGNLLKWVDEYAYIAAAMEYPGSNFVTIGMDRVEFRRSVRQGTILIFLVDPISRGRTSLQYSVHVYRGDTSEYDNLIFSTTVAFVRVDQDGKKILLPPQSTSSL
ncbi:MAG: acyl-CoA thioesterase [Desulfobulbaceae bacterium]|nr:acyl-CoA thioesterase [Desulfobulbaceae bacterium]